MLGRVVWYIVMVIFVILFGIGLKFEGEMKDYFVLIFVKIIVDEYCKVNVVFVEVF